MIYKKHAKLDNNQNNKFKYNNNDTIDQDSNKIMEINLFKKLN